jgi:hypothetical protein
MFVRVGGPNRPAGYWARRRAAELVGMARGTGDELVPHPDTRWRISDATRNTIRQIVADSFDGELQLIDGGKRPGYLQAGENRESDVIDHIQVALNAECGASSQRARFMRARLIAGTEIGRALIGSNLNLWRKSAVVKRVTWLCASGVSCADCAKNKGAEVEFGRPFPSGAYSPLDTHPLCRCGISVVAVI